MIDQTVLMAVANGSMQATMDRVPTVPQSLVANRRSLQEKVV